MNRTKQKLEHVGYELKIFNSYLGKKEWAKVGGLFKSKAEALEFKTEKFPEVTKYTISGVRINVEPIKVLQEKDKENENAA